MQAYCLGCFQSFPSGSVLITYAASSQARPPGLIDAEADEIQFSCTVSVGVHGHTIAQFLGHACIFIRPIRAALARVGE